jgi:FkbM family methyltransferase
MDLLALKGFRPDVIFDIGAAAGTVGLYDTWPDAQYILVEPLAKFSPDMEKLCRSLPRARYRIAAAGSEQGRAHIAYHPTEPHLLASAMTAPPEWPRDEVEKITVDQLLAECKRDQEIHSALLKIDVDGPEIDVLKGAAGTLTLSTVVLIEAPLHDQEIGRLGVIVDYMMCREYDCFDIIEPVFRPHDNLLWQVDLVFTPRRSSWRSPLTYEVKASQHD